MGILSSIKYAFYIIRHPFDGFWCQKREKRGNIKASIILIFLFTVIQVISKQFTAFVFNETNLKEFNLVVEVLTVIIPIILWCIANWSFTSLMDGEGTFRDIVNATAVCLLPGILFNLVLILLSYVLTPKEAGIYIVIQGASLIWCGFLFFVSTMNIHNYSLPKTLITILLVIVGMAVMIFLVLLFFVIIQQLVNFLYTAYKELSLRYI